MAILRLSMTFLLFFAQAGPVNHGPGDAPPAGRPDYGWRAASATTGAADTLQGRFPPPPGATRSPASSGSFAAWLRGLPLRPGKPDVRLHDGSLKNRQDVHAAVLDLDTGHSDLQQCADAVMRLRAEYLYARGQDGAISFHFTSGDACRWDRWSQGWRPVIRGNRVTWKQSAMRGTGRAAFREYLNTVFTYAGSASLEKELRPVPLDQAEPGDVFIQGGFPGHAVIVLDVAQGPGARYFLLAQSYMPAQDMHVLLNGQDGRLSPWYRADSGQRLVTPEWVFAPGSLRRWR